CHAAVLAHAGAAVAARAVRHRADVAVRRRRRQRRRLRPAGAAPAAGPRRRRPPDRLGGAAAAGPAAGARRAQEARPGAPGAEAAHRRRFVILAWVNGIVEGVQAFATGLRTTGRFLVENLRNEGGATAITRQYPEQPAETIGDRQRGHLFNVAEECIVC